MLRSQLKMGWRQGEFRESGGLAMFPVEHSVWVGRRFQMMQAWLLAAMERAEFKVMENTPPWFGGVAGALKRVGGGRCGSDWPGGASGGAGKLDCAGVTVLGTRCRS